MPAYQYTRTAPDGTTKTVGPFKTVKEAQRFVARALVDNGHDDPAAAMGFARTITVTSGPQTHHGSGIAYTISKEITS